MRRIIMAVMLSMAFLSIVGIGQAGADPNPDTNPSGNVFYFHLSCDQGYGQITITTTNMAAAGQVVGGNGVLVARSIIYQEVVAGTNTVLRGPNTWVWGQGQKTPHPGNLVTCSGATDPYTNEKGQLVQTQATYEMLVTPRR